MNDKASVTLAAAALSRAAPREWSEFLEAVKLRSDERRRELVSSSPPTVLVAQGRAQDAGEFYDLLRGCREQADRISAVRKNVKPVQQNY